MRLTKKILTAIVIILVAIQFIRPDRNIDNKSSVTDITTVTAIPDSVRLILRGACFDCHSNNTEYPWYSGLQPVGWLLAKDIKNGKDNLNFSEFGGYTQRRQLTKLDEIATVINEDIMPLSSYRMMHRSARLGIDEKTLLVNWAKQAADSLSAKE